MATVLSQNQPATVFDSEPKMDKSFLLNDIESEISNWLKFETEGSIGNSFNLGMPVSTGNTTTSAFPIYIANNDVSQNFSPVSYPSSQSESRVSSQEIPVAQSVALQNDFYCPSFSFPAAQMTSVPVSQLPAQQTSFTPFLTSQAQNQYMPVSFATTPFATQTPYYQTTQMNVPVNNSTQMNPAMATYANVPLFQLFSQFQQYLKSQTEETDEKKNKTKAPRPFVKRVRQTRPKVVESKGAVQCKGKNRKKGSQCRNAALMEYIGPRPVYCAEHIELDPKSLYMKCKSSYQKEPGDKKGCKEVVLKEFGVCYKHYADTLNDMLKAHEFDKIKQQNVRISELLTQLEKEAATAKKKDGDLYQRKNKLIPKFQEMKNLSTKAVEAIENLAQANGYPTLQFTAMTRPAEVASAPSTPELVSSPLSSSSDSFDFTDLSNSDSIIEFNGSELEDNLLGSSGEFSCSDNDDCLQ
mmetsp:Transcript_20643/g.28983  ORF Transcript_20643/g.28983 Transcript_20643/m.28983 type:complete len:468 (-) Transcript_20643:316-1719(-)